MLFQILFYSVMANFFFLGSMDHLLSRPGTVSATNKELTSVNRFVALWEVIKFNSGSWLISFYILCLCYASVLATEDWDYTVVPENLLGVLIFAGPAAFIAILSVIVPIILNPYAMGFPFYPPIKFCFWRKKKDYNRRQSTYATAKLRAEMTRIERKPDIEIGTTGSVASVGVPHRARSPGSPRVTSPPRERANHHTRKVSPKPQVRTQRSLSPNPQARTQRSLSPKPQGKKTVTMSPKTQGKKKVETKSDVNSNIKAMI